MLAHAGRQPLCSAVRTYGGLVAILFCFLLGGAAQAQLVPLTNVVQVAAGQGHSCVLTNVGHVKCWGSNSSGQLGDRSTVGKLNPVPVYGLGSGIQAVVAGSRFTCALTTGGGVKCWGSNLYGQLGDGGNTSRATPAFVSGLSSGAVALGAGDDFVCAVMAGGGVKCWGQNHAGQLGDGTATDRPTPVDVVNLGASAAAVDAGSIHTCVRTSTGGAKCWGGNSRGQLGDGTFTSRPTPADVTGLTSGVVEISTTYEHTCALLASGGVRCWGGNFYGTIGNGGSTDRPSPTDVSGLTSGAQAIAAGQFHTCAATVTGSVKCWGINSGGQLGDGSAALSRVPVDVVNLPSGVVDIVAGDDHTCAVVGGGGVKCWGRNYYGQLGNGRDSSRPRPVNVVGLSSGVQAIRGGLYHSCALTNADGAKCWGNNSSGQLGNANNVTQLTPVDVSGLTSGVQAIAVGERHSCALVAGGSVRCWGDNLFGQLGDGSTTDRNAPTQVSGLNSGVEAISAGMWHTCAIQSGAVKCWGNNSYGTLGNGDIVSSLVPVQVSGLTTGATLVTAGSQHSCAAVSGGGVRCWGQNLFGALGDGSDSDSLVPVPVAGLAGTVLSLGGGYGHTCAHTSVGSSFCWGLNNDGQLGTGTTVSTDAPVTPNGLGTNVAAIAVGEDHSCAIAGSTMKCWGRNSDGQVGDGTVATPGFGVSAPRSVQGLGNDVLAIGLGSDHTCAIAGDGRAMCWGHNEYGQVGDGTSSGFPTPQVVLFDGSAQAVDTLTDLADDTSLAPASDASGRYVVFESRAENLGPANTAGTADIYRVDTQTGDTLLLSTNNDGSPVGADAIEPSVSADGGIAVFVVADAGVSQVANEASSKTAARGKAGGYSVLLRNLIAGSTQRLAIPARPGGTGTLPQIAPTGNGVVYAAPTPSASFGPVGTIQIFKIPLVRNGDALVPGTPVCVSCKARGPGGKTLIDSDGESFAPTISADGRYVAWETTAKNLVTGAPAPCPGASTEIVLADLIADANFRVSTPPAPAQCGAAGTGARKPKIDWLGRKVVFESDQPLKPGDANGTRDIYLRDLSQAGLMRVSETLSGADATGASTEPSISGDGEAIAYVSEATNLDSADDDTNNKSDVHVRSLRDVPTRRLSKTRDGLEADSDSRRPALNYNGTKLAFDSDAGNLAPGAAGGVQNVFQRVNPLTSELIFAAGFD